MCITHISSILPGHTIDKLITYPQSLIEDLAEEAQYIKHDNFDFYAKCHNRKLPNLPRRKTKFKVEKTDIEKKASDKVLEDYLNGN